MMLPFVNIFRFGTIMHFSRFFRVLTALAFALGASACTAPAPPTGPALTACAAPRPQVCTAIYAPVCAAHTDGRVETYSSACNACADESVTGYEAGPCGETATP